MSKPTDLDLMLLADGEGDPAAKGGAALATTAEARAKIEGIREVGELVRTHLELSADEAEPRLAGLWDLVERRLDAEERAVAPAPAIPAPSLWGRLTGWMSRQRAPLLTGLVTAGAAAAVAVAVRPAPKVVTRYVQLPPEVQVPGPAPQPGPVGERLVNARPAEVESLDVSGGTGAVFTIEDDDGETTVIWVTQDDVEGT